LLAREAGDPAKLPAIELSAEGAATPARSFQPAPFGDEPGVYRGDFGQLPEGRYHARLAGAAADDTSQQVVFDVRRYDQEQLDLQARPALMARIAQDSGGAVLGSDPVGELSKAFHDHEAKAHPPQFERSQAWDRPWILLAVLGTWAVSWFVRRSGGLV
jgi:hypothetical protein